MKQFLLTMAGVFAALALFFIGLPLVLAVSLISAAKPAPTPAHAVLSLDLRQALPDQDPFDPFAFVTGRKLSLVSAVERIRQAATDPAVAALLVRLPEGGMAPASADELRGALAAFRTAGKPVIAHSQGLYPSGLPVATYMLGAASRGGFWMQPQSSLQATGSAMETLFFKRAFDKYGVQADFQQRAEYKTAVNPLLYDDYTPAHREEETGWMSSIYGAELTAAAADRRMTPEALRAALEAGPYLAQDARARGLIDHVGGVEEAEAELKRAAGDGAQLLDFNSYRPPATVRGGDSLALIGAEGAITTGATRNGGFGGANDVKSDDVQRAFTRAVNDPSVKAIIFRVSSPGGSDTASEQIGAAVRAAKAAGKPVVVSMGTYAASGGYWISADASEIVADPTTLTGSIGVFGGKFVVGPALARFGVDARDLSVGGPFADSFGSAKPFTPEQRAAVSNWMDQIYAGFLQRVSQGRRLPPEKVAALAKGRVWTGAQALQLGLVDKLGGYPLAVAEAKRLAGLPADRDAPVKRFDPQPGFGGMMQGLSTTAETVRLASQAPALLQTPQGHAAAAAVDRARLQLEGQATVLAPGLP